MFLPPRFSQHPCTISPEESAFKAIYCLRQKERNTLFMWRRKAQDRDQWRRIAQEAKAYVGL